MNRYSIVFIILCLSALPALHAQEQSPSDLKTTETKDLSIVVTSLDITDEALKVQYEIRNNSEDDTWILFQSDEYVSVIRSMWHLIRLE